MDPTALEKSQAGRMADAGLMSPKRFSDEGKDSKPTTSRKKSGFSGFVNSLVGSQRKPVISAPENPVHVTHVGYDSTTGQFTVSPALGGMFRGHLNPACDAVADANVQPGIAQRMAATHQRKWHLREGEEREPSDHD